MLEQIHNTANNLITSISENIDKVKQVNKDKEPPLTLQEKLELAKQKADKINNQKELNVNEKKREIQ